MPRAERRHDLREDAVPQVGRARGWNRRQSSVAVVRRPGHSTRGGDCGRWGRGAGRGPPARRRAPGPHPPRGPRARAPRARPGRGARRGSSPCTRRSGPASMPSFSASTSASSVWRRRPGGGGTSPVSRAWKAKVSLGHVEMPRRRVRVTTAAPRAPGPRGPGPDARAAASARGDAPVRRVAIAGEVRDAAHDDERHPARARMPERRRSPPCPRRPPRDGGTSAPLCVRERVRGGARRQEQPVVVGGRVAEWQLVVDGAGGRQVVVAPVSRPLREPDLRRRTEGLATAHADARGWPRARSRAPCRSGGARRRRRRRCRAGPRRSGRSRASSWEVRAAAATGPKPHTARVDVPRPGCRPGRRSAATRARSGRAAACRRRSLRQCAGCRRSRGPGPWREDRLARCARTRERGGRRRARRSSGGLASGSSAVRRASA